ncbi:tRNA(Ile)-lysidine synthase [Rhodopseudomonas rhenobacensis]|uniref:tRNA(Ile)-lysidine synthase n=1 Tax=Rhodopseudomonas rhenobacensis TaxID=87461 RepID=A0A7W7Z888_9BRAD|nr:tRNA lysidine(34) synthetase TilS [Rhodopseudomonas rhenobacensis]MBB5049778.1 tRNA(Ile)-lysidine synthase [Rhodopseudomonas rhenobacensis]
MADDDHTPISAQQARQLFADWRDAQAVVLAVSGGPDSLALMWLAARWRKALRRGPQILVITVDHGLRPEAAREARDVKRHAAELGLPHRTLRWRGDKPTTGLPAAARDARYQLLARAARAAGASHILTAHTQDDQAETLLMRMSRGSGIAGLAAMARQTERHGVIIARPLLEVSKARLVATLAKAGLDFVSDPSNVDPRYARPRWRSLIAAFAEEGLDARNLARLSARLARANAALDVVTDGAERFLALRDHDPARPGFEASAFAALPAEVQVRLLLRTIDRVGHEGPAELGKVETLVAEIDRAAAENAKSPSKIALKRTLAGALITLGRDRLRIEPAPPRRGSRR